MDQNLAERVELHAAASLQVLQPLLLPVRYSWLRKGFYVVYTGVFSVGSEKPGPHTWGWQVDHVEGETREGEKSCLGYTRYHNQYGDMFGDLLNWSTLFPCFFRIRNPLDDEIASTEIGAFACFKAARSVGQDRIGLTRIMWYDKQTSVLVKMEGRTPVGQLTFACSLAETTEPLLSSRLSSDADDSTSPASTAEREYRAKENLPWWKKLPRRWLGG